MDREKVIKGTRKCLSHKPCSENGCPYENECAVEHLNDPLLRDALAMLKEQEELLRKLGKDKDKLCLEVSEWKHKFHDAPPKFVSQGVVDQIRWERDTALSQLEQIGKGLGSKMDDIVAMLQEQKAVKPRVSSVEQRCDNCNKVIEMDGWEACPWCGKPIDWESWWRKNEHRQA